MNHTQDKFQNQIPVLLFSIFLVGCASGVSTRVHSVHVEQNSNKNELVRSPVSSVQDYLVIEGKGTKSIQIGMSRQQLVDHLGKPSDEYEHKGKCNYSELHWFPPPSPDGSVSGDGIFAFLKEERVFELRFGKGYQTNAGIGFGSPIGVLRDLVGAVTYELVPSSNTATNNRNLVYTVVVADGVAFELAMDTSIDSGLVNALYVFRRGEGFLPWGCIDANQRLVQLDKR